MLSKIESAQGKEPEQSQPATTQEKNKLLNKKLKYEINESRETVEKVKRGFSAFDLEAIKKAQ